MRKALAVVPCAQDWAVLGFEQQRVQSVQKGKDENQGAARCSGNRSTECRCRGAASYDGARGVAPPNRDGVSANAQRREDTPVVWARKRV